MHGIELSTAMVEQLRWKRGASDIGVTVGDFATVSVDGTFTLAYIVRNTMARTDEAGRMTVYLPAKLREWIRLECARLDISHSELVAQAVELLKAGKKR